MANVILVCGKIASGKSWYCRKLLKEGGRVLLSVDEFTTRLGPLGEDHDRVCGVVQGYLLDLAAQIAGAGTGVVLDWGFWTRDSRAAAEGFFRERGIATQWHYIDVPAAVWQENIARRNAAVLAGEDNSYYVDEGLLGKLAASFQPPEPGEMDVVVRPGGDQPAP